MKSKAERTKQKKEKGTHKNTNAGSIRAQQGRFKMFLFCPKRTQFAKFLFSKYHLV